MKNNKNVLIIVAILIVIIGGIFLLKNRSQQGANLPPVETTPDQTQGTKKPQPKPVSVKPGTENFPEIYTALKGDYEKQIIPVRKGASMIWDISAKQTTIDRGNVLDDQYRKTGHNLANICKNEIKYTDSISIYDCKGFYAIFKMDVGADANGWTLPANPVLYGPFEKGSTPAATVPAKYKTITGSGYTFEAPVSWNMTAGNGNSCQSTSIINAKQITSGTNPGQIDVWPKNCMPTYIVYPEKTDKGPYVVALSYDKNMGTTDSQITEAQAAYEHVLLTFKIK